MAKLFAQGLAMWSFKFSNGPLPATMVVYKNSPNTDCQPLQAKQAQAIVSVTTHR